MSRLFLLKALLVATSLGGCVSFVTNYSARDGGGPWAENGAKVWIIAGLAWVCVVIGEVVFWLWRESRTWWK